MIHVCEHKMFRALSTLRTVEEDSIEGLGSDGEPVGTPLVAMPLDEMLSFEFDTEAHFWPGFVAHRSHDLPRLSKSVLGQLRQQGVGVMMSAVVLDYDLKDLALLADAPRGVDGKKLPWTNLTDDHREIAWSVVHAALRGLTAKGLQPTHIYTSPNGLRFIHELATPIAAGALFEAYHKRVRGEYVLQGLDVDEACKDWTRLYKVPIFPHADKLTADHDWFVCTATGASPLEPNLAGLEVAEEVAIEVRPLDLGQPDHSYARSLVEVFEDGRWVPTEAGKYARTLLSGRDAKDYVFGVATPVGGQRHSTLVKVIGQVVGVLYGVHGIDPETVYGLVLPLAERMGTDEPWAAKAWEQVASFWARQRAKAETTTAQTQQTEAKREERALSARESFVSGVRSWAEEYLRDLDDSEALKRIVSLRLPIIVDRKAKEFRILRRDGYYDRTAYSVGNLKRRIRECDMEWLLPTTASVWKKDAMVTVDLSEDAILDQYCRTFSREIVKLHHGGNTLRIEGDDAVYVHSPFRLREDLEPKFDERVDTWLRAMVSPDEFERFQAATGYMLAIYDGPTAAVSLVGPPASGKKMYAHGLSECFAPHNMPIPGVEMTTKHNDALLKNPIIWIDEGVDDGKSGANFADVFRRVVTGGTIAIEPKGAAKIEVSGVHRVLFSANSLDALKGSTGGKARTSVDWQAIGERIVHFNVRDEAAQYLQSLGGLTGTRGWIEGDAGQPSRHVIARHFLWIYSTVLPRNADGQLVRQGKRLLIEGEHVQDVVQEIADEAPLVSTIALAVDQILRRPNTRGIHIHDGAVWAKSAIVEDEVRKRDSKTDQVQFRAAMRSVFGERVFTRAFDTPGYWRRVPVSDLVRILADQVEICDALRKAHEDTVANLDDALAEEAT